MREGFTPEQIVSESEINEKRAKAKDLPETWQRVRAYLDIAKEEAGLGVDSAQTFAKAVDTVKAHKDKFMRQGFYREIAQSQANLGRFDEALQTARGMEYKRDRGLTESDITIIQARAGRFDEARATASTMKHEELRERALQGIKEIEKMMTRSAESFDKEEAKINKSKDALKRNFALGQLASAEARAGFIERAHHTAEKITDEDHRNAILREIDDFEAHNKKWGIQPR